MPCGRVELVNMTFSRRGISPITGKCWLRFYGPKFTHSYGGWVDNSRGEMSVGIGHDVCKNKIATVTLVNMPPTG